MIGSALLFVTAPRDEREPSQGASLQVSSTLAPGLAAVSVSGAF